MQTLALHRAKAICGWMSDAELEFLAYTAQKSKVIFEIGSYMGRSTRALGDNTNGVVCAIDPWNVINYSADEHGIIFATDEVIFNMFYCNLHDLIKVNKVVPFKSKWGDCYPSMKADFIFIDGDHRYEEALFDIRKAKVWIDRRGIIAGHDYSLSWPGVIRAVQAAFPVEKINVVDTIWWVQL